MFCCRMEYFWGHFMLVCGSNWSAKDWYWDGIWSIWQHQTITTTVAMQPTQLYGQRMGSGHEMNEFRGQVGSEKYIFFRAQLPGMRSLYGRINASLCAADMFMHCPHYDDYVNVLE